MSLAIAVAIPVFFLLIGLELVAGRGRGVRVRFADAISALSCGIGQQMTGLLVRGALFATYALTWEHLRLWTWDEAWWGTWVAGLLLVDHQYYWWHRTTHRSRLFWATHVVHHQSEDYNLPVALRQAWFSAFTSAPFQLPIALIGIPPHVYLTAALIDLLYQFWIHTELIDRLGPLEWIFNTPSHHRVHHGVNPAYIDRNHAGILIVWDRLYGTFVEERERPTYGTVTPFGSGDPVWANVEPFVAMARDLRRIPSWADKVRYVLGPPEWRPACLGGPVVIPEPVPHRITWDPRPPRAVRAYVLAWFVATGIVTTAALAVADTMPWGHKTLVVVAVVGTTWVWAPMLEGKAWGAVAEKARLALLATIVVGEAAMGGLPGWAAAAIVATFALSAWLVPATGDARPPAAPLTSGT